MYRQTEYSAETERNLHALSIALHAPDCEACVYKQMVVLSQYTAEKPDRKEIAEAKRSFCPADPLYANGNSVVRSEVEHVFIYALTSALGGRARGARRKFVSFIPNTLYTLYVKQVL